MPRRGRVQVISTRIPWQSMWSSQVSISSLKAEGMREENVVTRGEGEGKDEIRVGGKGSQTNGKTTVKEPKLVCNSLYIK